MLIDDARTRERVWRIACRLSSDPALREDLIQEALVHLWLMEERRPRQRQSWYLQSCKFHLQNYISAGRSVDSLKRRGGQTNIEEHQELGLNSDVEEDEVFSQVSARDILTLLTCRLTPFERAILNHLVDGMSAREIASQLSVAHPTVIKYRRRIASQAMRLGIAPMEEYKRVEPPVMSSAS